jgi:hypothetical protein
MPERRFPPPWSFLFLRRLQHLAGHGVCRRISHRRPNDSSCAGTTDTDMFAEYKSASHGKFGRSTSASRIEDKTEQKSALRLYLSLQAGSRQSTRVAYQMAFTGSARHQVSESIPLSCAIACEHPVLNCVAGDNGAVSSRCRICLHSTSVQQTRTTLSAPNICWSLR